jgi:ADP-ribose pyrophosphatase YjhB (NUDIX family)
MMRKVTRASAWIWKHLAGWLRWRLVWLGNAKFIVSVVGVIVNEAGEVLLLRHRYWPSGTWGLPGGYVKRGERVESALARELKEETGYEVCDVRVIRIRSGYRLRMEVVLTGRISGGTRRVDPVEILEARFFQAPALPPGLLPEHRDHALLVCS